MAEKGDLVIRVAERWASRSRGSATTRCSRLPAPAGSAWSRSRASASRSPPAPRRSPTAWWSRPSSPRRSPTRPSTASWSCCWPTTRWTARPATRAVSARCRTRRCPTAGSIAVPRAQARVREADPHLQPGAPRPRALHPVPALHPVLRGDRRRQVHRPDGPVLRRADQRLPGRLLRARGTINGQAVEGEGDVAFNSYFSRNTIQICPVGALTGEQYRFRARPFDLVSTPTACEHCAAGCSMRADHRPARCCTDSPATTRNEEWNCDKGRWGFATPRPTTHPHPAVRDKVTGDLPEASWSEALLRGRRANGGQGAGGDGVLTGGRLTVEDAYTSKKFAQIPLGTTTSTGPSVSSEETDSSPPRSAGVSDVTYEDVENAPERSRGRAGAGGRVPDPLPAAAQGPQPQESCRSRRSRRTSPGVSVSSARP